MQSLGVIIGNRDIFPDHLVSDARGKIISFLEKQGVKPVMVSESETNLGGVETYAEARKCADLFKAHADEIEGILVVLPNFGDEQGIADTIRLSGLSVPVLIQAFPDDPAKLQPSLRRDSFCGKISVCNNLTQYGIPFTLTTDHVVSIESDSFEKDFDSFLRVCRVVKKMQSVRLGAVGARPDAFKTVRFSEKILDRNGVSVSTVDLSEIFASIDKLGDGDTAVANELGRIEAYASIGKADRAKIIKMAKLGVILREWIDEHSIDAVGFQCWSSIQANLGINPCTVMSMLSEELVPSACEVDVTGVLTMYAMQHAAGSPAGIVDWNNNYGDVSNKCVFFHCGNWAKSLTGGETAVSVAPILGSTLGVENTAGALEARAPAGPLTYGRLTTHDTSGLIRAYLGEGSFTDDELDTFGSRAVVEIPDLQKLMRHICNHGFEHHVVMTRSSTAAVLEEAFSKYLGWEVYRHG